VRGQIAEAAVERKALIKEITDFIKTVLLDITLTQKVATPKRESVEYGTQTAPPPPTRVVPLPSTSSVGDEVYEAETSPVSTRFTGPPAPAAASDDDDHDDGETGAISEGDVHAFARKSFGSIASPYLSYVHRHGVLDTAYGLRKVGNKFFIGNSDLRWMQIATSTLMISILEARGVSGNYSLGNG
jgi:hypothetical protein